MNIKNYLTVSVTAIAVALGGVTYSSTAVAQDDTSASDDVIIVSARKRNERLQDVPVAVSVYDEASVERLNLSDVEDTYGVTPGLYFTGNFLSPNKEFRQLVVRGVGANSQLEPSVATFIDGVYSPSLSFDLDFLDVERVELLKGPQGTLFGRNTEGGALNIISRKPDDELRRKVKFDYSSFDTAEASGSISGPLIAGKLFGSAAVSLSHSDGFVENRRSGGAELPDNPFFPGRDIEQEFNSGFTNLSEATNERRAAARGSIRYIVNDSIEINMTGNVSRFRGQDQAPGPLSSCQCYFVTSDIFLEHESNADGASVTVDWDLGGATLTSISGWRRLRASTPFDFDGTDTLVNNYHDFDTFQESYSQELRVASNGDGRLQWLIGSYYFDDTNNSNRFYNFANLDDPTGAGPQATLDGLWNQQIVDVDRNGAAGFGQIIYDITDRLELSAGVRYSWEEADVSALERFEIPPNGIITDLLTGVSFGWTDFFTPVTDSESWDSFTPMASLRYSVSDNASVYFTYSEGFKAGGYQKAPVIPDDVFPIDPENIRNFEVGTKGNLFNGGLTFDLAAYFLELEDMQLQAAVNRDGIVASAITNASTAEVKGFEASFVARPAEPLTFWANAGYVNSEFTDYQIFNGVTTIDRTGDAFPNTPEWTYYVGGEYRHPVLDTIDLVLYGGFRYVDEIYVGSDAVAEDPIIDVPDWTRLDISASLEGESWALKLYADNATDEFIVLSRWNTFFAQPAGDFIHDRVDAPRRIGVSFTQRF